MYLFYWGYFLFWSIVAKGNVIEERHRPRPPPFAWALVYCVLALLLLPLLMMIFTSLTYKNSDGTFEFTLRYWGEVLQDTQLGKYVFNSFFVAIFASSLSVLIGSCAALALVKTNFIGERFLKISSLASLVFPEIVFALSLLALFFCFNFQLSLWTVIMAHISFSLPYVMLTVGARAATLDSSLDDSARDLGASDWQLMYKIHFPLLKPAIVCGFFLSFLLSFDDFLITFFVNGVGSDTLPIKLYTSMKSGITPQLNALTTIIFLVTTALLVVLFQSRFFAKSLEIITKKT